eukprot:scaffold6130_cov50-Phaeocystis_antarctica.AAC.1
MHGMALGVVHDMSPHVAYTSPTLLCGERPGTRPATPPSPPPPPGAHTHSAMHCAMQRAWVGEADLPLERVGEEVGRAEGLVERRHREGVGPAEACSTQGELKVMAGLKGLGQPKPAQGWLKVRAGADWVGPAALISRSSQAATPRAQAATLRLPAATLCEYVSTPWPMRLS